MQTQRKAITAGELYVMLDREFRMRQSRDCGGCYILLPFRVDQPDSSTANWEVIPPPECRFNCAKLIDELVSQYAEVYDLAPDNGNN